MKLKGENMEEITTKDMDISQIIAELKAVYSNLDYWLNVENISLRQEEYLSIQKELSDLERISMDFNTI